MATTPPTNPDRIDPQSPPETPQQPDEPVPSSPPETEPLPPDFDQPDRSPDEFPGPGLM
ncbi:hypothetical protein [Altererythrobacter sp. ZODW24]|uniref:hypothetical protein n=1 Tax=Altererythrobacter sp. ZODW24 TaxID=2185142 RepID=UPI0019626E00|nr:hypothetical protein [Altererythrobacter sp. ZODW24]